MKYISFILTLLCLCYQTEQQAVTSATTSTLQASIASTTNKHISKDEGSGIIKAQYGTTSGRDRGIGESYKKKFEEEERAKVEEAKEQQGGVIGFDEEGFNADIAKFIAETKAEEQQQQQAKAQQGGTLDFAAGIERLYQEEMAKQQADSQINPLRVTILTYGTIGIVSVFIIVAIVAFGILYARKNKYNPKHNKS